MDLVSHTMFLLAFQFFLGINPGVGFLVLDRGLPSDIFKRMIPSFGTTRDQ